MKLNKMIEKILTFFSLKNHPSIEQMAITESQAYRRMSEILMQKGNLEGAFVYASRAVELLGSVSIIKWELSVASKKGELK